MHTGKLSIFKKRHHRTIHNTKHKGASQKKIYYSEHLWLRCDMENKGKIMSTSRKFCSVPSPSLYSSRARTWVQQPVAWGGDKIKEEKFQRVRVSFYYNPHQRTLNRAVLLTTSTPGGSLPSVLIWPKDICLSKWIFQSLCSISRSTTRNSLKSPLKCVAP